jgi:hypothetical protein
MSEIELSRRMTTQDASFRYGESKSGPLHFGGVAIFEGSIDLKSYVGQAFEELKLAANRQIRSTPTWPPREAPQAAA